MPTKQDPNELIEVAFVDLSGNRHPKVKMPRRLINSGSQRARQSWLIQHGEIPDPSAPPLPDPVAVVIEEVREESAGAQQQQVEALRQQLDAIQSQLDGQPLSHAELVAARQEITALMLKAADAGAQLVQVEGRGSAIKSDLTAIAAPLQEQAAETARQQAENNEVTERVLGDLQAQAAALLATLSADAAAVRAEAVDSSVAASINKAVPAAEKAARQVANQHWGSSVTIAPEDPTKVDESSWAQRWYGRDKLIEGDGAFVTSKDGITAFRYTGNGWVKSAELNPRVEIVSQPISILDQSTKVTATLPPQSSSSGGASPDVMKSYVGGPNPGSYVRLAGDDRFAAAGFTEMAQSALISAEVVVLDAGPMAGMRGSWLISAELDKMGTSNIAVYACLGELAAYGSPEIELRRVPNFVKPNSVTGVFVPHGAVHCIFTRFETYQGIPAVITNISLRGWVKFNWSDRIVDAEKAAAWTLADELR